VTGRAGEPTGLPVVDTASLPAWRTLRALWSRAAGSVLHQFTRYSVVRGPPSSACMLAACVALCLAAQASSGAWSAGFFAYPDEPSHFVGAVMVRDWLASGRWLAPLEFARSYYDHYPYFAVGYWPPLFSVVAGLWMLVAGVGREQALFIPAVCAAGTGWLVFHFVRRRVSMVAGLCAGAVYLSLPAVRQWMCAVMVDHVTAFFCVAAAACLVRYLKQPVLWNGILCAVCCGCAILSKYSAAYIVALPLLAVVLLRRFELLRKPSFLVQPVVVALLVGPWALWTRRLVSYGLPSEGEALTVNRAVVFVAETFQFFPPVLMAVVVLGLIALLVRPRAWREDFVVLGLLCVGHLAFLNLSPVDPDQRYLLVPVAVLLVAAFAGWSEVLSSLRHGGRWASVISVLVAILTTVFVVFEFSRLERAPRDPIGNVVAVIVKSPARAAQRIVVPEDLEGPFIADFMALCRHRPDYYLLRPNKTLAHSDWFGLNYSSAFVTPEEMLEYFRQHPVHLIVWNEQPASPLKAHVRLMSEMLRRYPLVWHKVLSLDSAGGPAPSLTVYEYRMTPQEMR